MMKKTTLIAVLILTAGCGGQNSDPAYSVNASYQDRLKQFEENLTVTANLAGADGAILSNETLAQTENGVWHFEVEPFGGADISKAQLSVNFWCASSGAGKSAGVEYDAILLAVARVALPHDDTPISIAADSYDYTPDLDLDGLPNIDELSLGVNPRIADTDGDGVPDGLDVFPSVSGEWLDTDGDGTGDNDDDDIDGDGLANDDEDIRATDRFKWDTDGDGVYDGIDLCPLKQDAEQRDTDGDKNGNACDDDSDADGLSDSDEARLGTDRLNADTDGDGAGDALEIARGSDPKRADTDGDGVGDKTDNCPIASNSNQSDIDRDGAGDECDADRDGDGIENTRDNCPDSSNNFQDNADADGLGDSCDADADNDGVLNDTDNCPFKSNPGQIRTDSDADGVSADCDLDDTDAGVRSETDAIFVDGAHGSDSARGTRTQPLATIATAVARAAFSGLRIYVAAGSYNTSALSMPAGAQIYGGFANAENPASRFASRNVRSDSDQYKTALSRGDTAITLSLSANGIVIDGFFIENTSSAFDEIEPSVTVDIVSGSATLERNTINGNATSLRSTGLRVRGGAALVSRNRIDGGAVDARSSTSSSTVLEGGVVRMFNNILISGAGRFATGLSVSDTDPLVINNTIDARSGSTSFGVAEGVEISGSSPVLVNNIIVTGNAPDQTPLVCAGSPPGNTGSFRGNLFATFPLDATAPVVRDCDGMNYAIAEFSMGTATVSSNARFAEDTFAELLDTSYAPLYGANDGLNSGAGEFGSVIIDFDGAPRPAGGGYAIGAIER